MSKWIGYDEQRPPIDEDIMVWTDAGLSIVRYESADCLEVLYGNTQGSSFAWRHLPKPPTDIIERQRYYFIGGVRVSYAVYELFAREQGYR